MGELKWPGKRTFFASACAKAVSLPRSHDLVFDVGAKPVIALASSQNLESGILRGVLLQQSLALFQGSAVEVCHACTSSTMDVRTPNRVSTLCLGKHDAEGEKWKSRHVTTNNWRQTFA
jgi:hypothetical protein